MTAWVLLLRGINVGGSGLLPMAGLRTILHRVGCQDVSTYIQSGNAVFRSDLDRDQLVTEIADAIESGYGFRPAVFLIEAQEIQAALAQNPFPQAQSDPKSLHLFFHDNATADMPAIAVLLAGGEAVHWTPTVFYLYARDGIGRSRLAERLPRLINGPMTGRNLRTCMKVCEMGQALLP